MSFFNLLSPIYIILCDHRCTSPSLGYALAVGIGRVLFVGVIVIDLGHDRMIKAFSNKYYIHFIENLCMLKQ